MDCEKNRAVVLYEKQTNTDQIDVFLLRRAKIKVEMLKTSRNLVVCGMYTVSSIWNHNRRLRQKPNIDFSIDAGNTIHCCFSTISAYSLRKNSIPLIEELCSPRLRAAAIFLGVHGELEMMAGVPLLWKWSSRWAVGCRKWATFGWRSPWPRTSRMKSPHERDVSYLCAIFYQSNRSGLYGCWWYRLGGPGPVGAGGRTYLQKKKKENKN